MIISTVLLSTVMTLDFEQRWNPPAEQAEVVHEEPAMVSLGEYKITHYCSCPKCCGKYADGITYTGTQATAGRTVAVDPDVIPLGSEIIIDGHTYIAEDIGGAIQGNRIDIYCKDHETALSRGVITREVFKEEI
jgi:3D (Asp-Asp-Asp) domain-containing protein